MLFTGDDQPIADQLAAQLMPPLDPSYIPQILSSVNTNLTINGAIDTSWMSRIGLVLGTAADAGMQYYVERAFYNVENGLFAMAPNSTCMTYNLTGNFTLLGYLDAYLTKVYNDTTYSYLANTTMGVLDAIPVICVDSPTQYLPTWQAVQDAIYCGYRQARCNGTSVTDQYSAAWNFQDTNATNFNVEVAYNRTILTGTNDRGRRPLPPARIPQSFNLAFNTWIKNFINSNYTAQLLGISGMPKGASKLRLDFSSLLGPLFYTWVVQLLLPTYLQQLVYEKEKKLRMMMKMHGLGDGPYWLVTYLWYLLLYIVYIIIYLVVGSLIRLKIFTKTQYAIQIIFYFIFGNNMIAFCFLLSSIFSNSRTAVVTAFLYVFASGLIGDQILEVFMADNPGWMVILELVPCWALYRGLYEMGEYAFLGTYRNTKGMTFANLGDKGNGMLVVWAILLIEWPIFMILAWYLEQTCATGTGVRKPWNYCLPEWCRCRKVLPKGADPPAKDARLAVREGEMPDVVAEVERVDAMSEDDKKRLPIVVQGLRKQYPGQDGGKPKLAVKTLTLAVDRSECFGLLGPNGAGKSTSINMLTGFLEPSQGRLLVEGMDLSEKMSKVYSIMGVCPQHDLQWEKLTGREHLYFYGRLKGLMGAELKEAVEEALRGVNLLAGGWGDKQSRQYSGGMRRRLSVAISFIGKPKVVYLDEPSTGLDPASRRTLWEVVKSSKRGRAIILTTHSMEEAEVLCDRLGIFVDGRLVCIGNPKEITSRYAGYLVFTITVPQAQEASARQLVTSFSPNAQLTYSVGGTLKYELPKTDVSLSGVFNAMNQAKSSGTLDVLDWGCASATLEEVFIKFARSIGAQGNDMDGDHHKGNRVSHEALPSMGSGPNGLAVASGASKSTPSAMPLMATVPPSYIAMAPRV